MTSFDDDDDDDDDDDVNVDDDDVYNDDDDDDCPNNSFHFFLSGKKLASENFYHHLTNNFDHFHLLNKSIPKSSLKAPKKRPKTPILGSTDFFAIRLLMEEQSNKLKHF